MSKLFDKERLASKILQEAREQAPPPAQSAEEEREAKRHIRLLEETDTNIHQLNSRLEQFREDLSQMAQTMEARKVTAQPEPVPAPSVESSSAGWFGRIVIFAIGLGIGAVVMIRNAPPEPVEPAVDEAPVSMDAKAAEIAVRKGAENWDAVRQPSPPAVAARPLPPPAPAPVVEPEPVVKPAPEPEPPQAAEEPAPPQEPEFKTVTPTNGQFTF